MKTVDMKTVDIKFSELCDEIDFYKSQAEYYKAKYETERQKNVDKVNKDLERTQRDVANALLFALSVKDDENGNLIIEKDVRKTLADNLKF